MVDNYLFRFSKLLLLVFLAALQVGCGDINESSTEGQTALVYTSNQEITYLLSDKFETSECCLKDPTLTANLQILRDNLHALTVPEKEWEGEPYVVALSTRSLVPTLLLLDAPWVRYYGDKENWLDVSLLNDKGYNDCVDIAEAYDDMPASLREAFSNPNGDLSGTNADRTGSIQKLAFPQFIKGNILFYRKDLIPDPSELKTWASLTELAEKILKEGKTKPNAALKYGLLFHIDNVINDFLPIFWGYGLEIENLVDGADQKKYKTRLINALKTLKEFVYPEGGGTGLSPASSEFDKFRKSKALRESFFRGEALFMINWNTRLHDLIEMHRIESGRQDKDPKGFISPEQIGVLPIPCGEGFDTHYVNIGSFAWGVNKQALKDNDNVKSIVKIFFKVIANECVQKTIALKFGLIPSRGRLTKELDRRHQQISRLFHNKENFAGRCFKVHLRSRPFRRDCINLFNQELSKLLTEYGYTADMAADSLCQKLGDLFRE